MGQQDIVDLLKAGIAEARKTSKALVLRKVFTEVPTWEEFISHLNHEYHNNTIPPQVPNPGQAETHINGVCIRDNFYLNIRRPGADSNDLSSAVNLGHLLREAFGVKDGGPLVSFVNFVGNDSPLNIHYDKRDMVYWQCIGTVEWRLYGRHGDIEEADPDVYESYILYPGDLLILPDKIFHAVKADFPRAAVSFGFNDTEWL